jgi:ABC-type phosphate/phosphonate transport system substrate-binding protein
MNSNSGMNVPRLLFSRGHRNGTFFDGVVVSGSHVKSADLVSTKRVDAAAIDCVSFALLQQYRPALVRHLRIIAETVSSPTPPFVTSSRTSAKDVAALRAGLTAFFQDPAHAPVRAELLLGGIQFCDQNAYAVIMRHEQNAQRNGYPVLR